MDISVGNAGCNRFLKGRYLRNVQVVTIQSKWHTADLSFSCTHLYSTTVRPVAARVHLPRANSTGSSRGHGGLCTV